MRSVMHSPVLVLNASYEPLHICAARRALVLIVKDAAHIQEHAGREVHAGIMFPTVIRLRSYRRVPHRIRVLTRKNILVRDSYQCQYCGKMFSAMELTLDHVIPRSKGGLSTWENLGACCSADNRRKADRTPEEAGLKLQRRPRPLRHSAAFTVQEEALMYEKDGEKYFVVDSHMHFWNAAPDNWVAFGLPPGVAVSAKTGRISGTPTATGSFKVVVFVSDSTTPTHEVGGDSYSLAVTK